MLYQQGDVLIRLVDAIPEGLTERKDGILAEGEATGHAHRILGDGVKLFESPLGDVYMDVPRRIEVVHEEHKKISLPPGKYQVKIVQEYDHFAEEFRRAAIRNVVD